MVEDTKERREYMMNIFAGSGLKEKWLSYLDSSMHTAFEQADMNHDFDFMFAMLNQSEDIAEFLCWHVRMTRDCFGPYNIESQPAFSSFLHLVVDAQ